ncbi:MAG: ABC transporter ATP-binding protein [Rhizobiaceae bacterium]
MSSALFETSDLTKIYGSGEAEVRALDGVSTQLHEGEVSVFLGPSGSGKSTFLNIVGGLDEATSGSVRFADAELTNRSQRQLTLYRRNHVGFVFQFYNLIPSLTAWENVSLVTEVAPNPIEPIDALAMVDLADRAKHFPAQLSGGEQQRVAIARAVAKRPEVLLCDEPTGALDSATGIVVLQVLKHVNEEFGTTTAIITHNAGIRKMANRVFFFRDGKIVEIEENDHQIDPTEIEW